MGELRRRSEEATAIRRMEISGKPSRELENALETARELHQCEVKNIANLMHYAKGKRDHVALSGYALQVRDAIIEMMEDKEDIETKWDDLTKALGAHGAESDPLTGSDTNDTIHQRAMDRIQEIEVALRELLASVTCEGTEDTRLPIAWSGSPSQSRISSVGNDPLASRI